jgi:hypothetical protein
MTLMLYTHRYIETIVFAFRVTSSCHHEVTLRPLTRCVVEEGGREDAAAAAAVAHAAAVMASSEDSGVAVLPSELPPSVRNIAVGSRVLPGGPWDSGEATIGTEPSIPFPVSFDFALRPSVFLNPSKSVLRGLGELEPDASVEPGVAAEEPLRPPEKSLLLSKGEFGHEALPNDDDEADISSWLPLLVESELNVPGTDLHRSLWFLGGPNVVSDFVLVATAFDGLKL